MYEKELSIAIKAVEKGVPTFKKYFGTKTKVEKKNNSYRNLVSYADKKIETDIKRFLLKLFPTHGFIGEEHGTVNGNAKFVWTLDPIDGTTNYLQGLSDCAISLALLKDNQPVVGVVSSPQLKKLYTASRQGGARLNDRLLKVSNIQKVEQAFGALGWGRKIDFALEVFPKLLKVIRKLRVPGSAALGICFVAQGSYDFFIDGTMNIWDYAAGQIIIEEAGGELLISDNPKIQIASNKFLGPEVLSIVK